jgi:hypothetical protein
MRSGAAKGYEVTRAVAINDGGWVLTKAEKTATSSDGIQVLKP